MIHEDANINVSSVDTQATNFCNAPRNVNFCRSNEGAAVIGTLTTSINQPNLADTVPFYGVGGGIDINLKKYVGIRFSTDFVRTHLFPNLLPWQNNVRFSVGPTWKLGDITTPLRQPKEPKQPKQPKTPKNP
jgi:hypothetical protein